MKKIKVTCIKLEFMKFVKNFHLALMIKDIY